MGILDAPPRIEKPGILLPPSWGASWREARSEADSRIVPIVAWGDSITQGLGASDFRTTSWFGRLVTDLQALYGDGGSGFCSVVNALEWTPNMHPGTVQVTCAGGSWAPLYAGVNEAAVYVSTTNATVTFPNQRGTELILHYLVHPTYGSMQVRIDGVLVDTINCAVTPYRSATSNYTVAAGTHTVEVKVSSTGLPVVVCGVDARNAAGILGVNMGHGGRTSPAAWGVTGLADNDYVGRVSVEYMQPDLFLTAVLVNDLHLTGATYATDRFAYNVRGVLDYARAWQAGANTDCIIVAPHVGKWEAIDPVGSGIKKGQDAVGRLRAMAAGRGDAMVDFWGLGRTSWEYWDSLGYWTDLTYSGAAGDDLVHPSNAGHAYMADTLKAMLVA